MSFYGFLRPLFFVRRRGCIYYIFLAAVDGGGATLDHSYIALFSQRACCKLWKYSYDSYFITVFCSFFSVVKRVIQYWLDKSTIHVVPRWCLFLFLLCVFFLRIYLVQGYFIVAYGLGIFLLNNFIGKSIFSSVGSVFVFRISGVSRNTITIYSFSITLGRSK